MVHSVAIADIALLAPSFNLTDPRTQVNHPLLSLPTGLFRIETHTAGCRIVADNTLVVSRKKSVEIFITPQRLKEISYLCKLCLELTLFSSASHPRHHPQACGSSVGPLFRRQRADDRRTFVSQNICRARVSEWLGSHRHRADDGGSAG